MSRLKGLLAFIRGNMPLHKGLSFSNSYADEKLINFIYHTNYCVKRGFPALRKALTTQVKKYRNFLRVFDIANQLMTRHSPFAPLAQI